MTNPTPYIAASDTSRARAERMDANGTTHHHRHVLLELLADAGTDGRVWSELADVTELHHGQVSSALSKLHAGGQIFQLRTTRARSHPYVHAMYRARFMDNEVNDAPVKTRANAKLEVLEEIRGAAHDLFYGRGDMAAKWNRLHAGLDAYNKLGANNED